SPRRDARDGIGSLRKCTRDPGHLRREPQPLASEPERRALVADERAQATGARYAARAVAPQHDRARAGEPEKTGTSVERAQQRGLDVGDDLHASRERAQSTTHDAALARRPHPARGHDERIDRHATDYGAHDLADIAQRSGATNVTARAAVVDGD